MASMDAAKWRKASAVHVCLGEKLLSEHFWLRKGWGGRRGDSVKSVF